MAKIDQLSIIESIFIQGVFTIEPFSRTDQIGGSWLPVQIRQLIRQIRANNSIAKFEKVF